MRDAGQGPDDVHPALWAELVAVMGEVRRLAEQRDAASEDRTLTAPPECQVTLRLPEELVLHLAWVAVRQDQRGYGKDDATGLSLDAMREQGTARLMRNYVRPFIYRTLFDLGNRSAKDLRSGDDPVLRPGPGMGAWNAPRKDLDDGIPF